MISKEQMRAKIASESEAVIDVHTHVGVSPGGYISQGYPYCLSLEDLAIRMKILGISYSVVFPFGSFYYALSRTKEKKVRGSGRISRFPYELANQNLLNEIFEIFRDLFSPAENILPNEDNGNIIAHIAKLFFQINQKIIVTDLVNSIVFDF